MPKRVVAGQDFQHIPKGPCLIGSQEGDPIAFSDEFPQHTIDLDYDYWCARFPVSNRQFGQFAAETGFITLTEKLGWAYVFNSQGDNWEKIEAADWRHPTGPDSSIDLLSDHPVVSIGFYDALAYVNWLNRKYKATLPESFHFRLPTEVQWEKAARGPDGRRYPWGNSSDPMHACWYESGPTIGTMANGSFSPAGDSIYGCADMAGNTWDWTTTLWGPDKDTQQFKYPYQPDDGREDQVAGKDFYRIIRGGSFKNNPEALRCACRDIDPVDYALNNLGFRIFITPNK